MKLAPIILFVYNRPEHTRKTVEALQKNELASESMLYIFADGPKDNADKNTLDKISVVRKYIHTITGFKDIVLKEKDKNKGLDPSIIDGVSEVLNKHGRCIVLEDDIVTHPWFLRYMNECLEHYEDDNRVSMIGGYSPRFNKPFCYRKDVYLVHRCCSWGWGTWKNVWDEVDWKMNESEKFIEILDNQNSLSRGGNDILSMFLQQLKLGIYTWDVSFDYFMCRNNSYCLRPIKSLTRNCGFDGTGVHCLANYDIDSRTADTPLGFRYNINTKDAEVSHNVEERFRAFYENKLKGLEMIWIPLKHRLHVIRLSLLNITFGHH